MEWPFARAVTRHWRVLRVTRRGVARHTAQQGTKAASWSDWPGLLRDEMNTKSPPMLTPKQSRFVEEYVVDLNGKQAAVGAGYSAKSAEVQASRLLRNTAVQAALGQAMQARSRRTAVTADRVVTEFARLAFANMRDYWPRPGETIDLHRLDRDLAAAIEEITIDEVVDAAGILHRRTRLKLHDKKGALDSLARHLGLFVDRHAIEGSLEHRVINMSSEERLKLMDEIVEEGLRLLPTLNDFERRLIGQS
jgi:phage terminase small subunit